MTENEDLTNLSNYKILIQQKYNRRKKQKTKYLTKNFLLSENINNALEFKNFQEAEEFLNTKLQLKNIISHPRIIIKCIND